MSPGDITRVRDTDPHWYRKIWTLGIKSMSWTESTNRQVDFLWSVLGLARGTRVLDLACGFGRHALELARRGCIVTGVDITRDYVDDATTTARAESLDATFLCADVREVAFVDEFDVVLNLADGAIGYLENDDENLKIFDAIARALCPGGHHLMDVCNGGYAAKHFPRRAWEIGETRLSLADFEWDAERHLMYYGGLSFAFGAPLERPTEIHSAPTRLYSLPELQAIFAARGMSIVRTFADFDEQKAASDDTFQMQVRSDMTGTRAR